MVTPCSFRLRRMAKISCTITGARPREGSSISSTRGSDMSPRPMASICASPPDREPAACRRRSFRRGNSPYTRSRLRASAGRCGLGKAPMARFSSTVMSRKIMRPSGIMAMPRAAISQVLRPVRGKPSSTTSPRCTGMRPMMARSRVVLPAPLGPMMAVSWPRGKSRDTPHNTLMAP